MPLNAAFSISLLRVCEQVRGLRALEDVPAWWHNTCSGSHAQRSAMSKHDTITKNLLTLTHSRSFVKAVDGWFVKKLVTLL